MHVTTTGHNERIHLNYRMIERVSWKSTLRACSVVTLQMVTKCTIDRKAQNFAFSISGGVSALFDVTSMYGESCLLVENYSHVRSA